MENIKVYSIDKKCEEYEVPELTKKLLHGLENIYDSLVNAEREEQGINDNPETFSDMIDELRLENGLEGRDRFYFSVGILSVKLGELAVRDETPDKVEPYEEVEVMKAEVSE